MHPCCDTARDVTLASRETLTVALAGNPNSGKTTIFNALTGLRQKVANYPGVTVEKKTGRCKLPDGRRANVIDLPGTYSLISRSPDEQVAMEVLRGLRADTPAPDVVVVVVDASNLQRNLYLVSQLVELGRPMVVALNMMDIAERRGLRISAPKLASELGVPVVPVVGHKRKGIDELKAAIDKAAVAPMPDWPLPQAMKEEVVLVGGALSILESGPWAGEAPGEGEAPAEPRHAVSPNAPGSADFGELSRAGASPSRFPRCKALAERLLIGDRAADIAPLAAQRPVSKLLTSAAARLSALGIDPMQADIEAHYHWIDNVVAGALVPACEALTTTTPTPAEKPTLDYAPAKTATDKVDSVLIHKVWGLLIFAGIMAALFVTIFWLADPIMKWIDDGTKLAGAKIAAVLPAGPIKDLLKDGIFAGVGAVIVFVPQIALLFLFLAIMEDSGYLARAAFLMDRVLSKVGLHGKSFIPLLSSFACAIPGIMATRTIENRKDRLATIFVAPFMSCSARLPVYALLIGAFFSGYGALAKGGILLSLYLLGIVAAAGTAWVFKRSFLKGPATTFILELPTYKVPQARQVARQVWTNTSQFLIKAGTAIFLLSILLWAMTYYPRLPADRAEAVRAEAIAHPKSELRFYDLRGDEAVIKAYAEQKQTKFREEQADKAVAGEQLRHSLAGRLGHVMEPVIRPLGFDWKMGVGLVGAFAAREVFVSTLGIVYSVGDPGEETTDLQTAMHADTYSNGRPVWTPLVAVSLLVWFVLAMQCMSTLAVVRRETGSWKWALAMLLYMNALAYVVCLGVYQVGRLLV
jgi:ferrous iron transport protein B